MSISGKTRVLGVWGFPVGHSRSPAMHNAAIAALGLDWVYVAFQVDPSAIPAAVSAVRALDLVGVNITVPLKELVSSHLDEVDPAALKIGAVNTIVNREGRLVGYSSDGPGFLWDIKRRGVEVDGCKALIWGAGGSARAIAFALASRGCHVVIANRTIERAAALADAIGGDGRSVGYESAEYAQRISEADLLVNATTLGMAPENIQSAPPLPPESLSSRQVVYDLVYAPEKTVLLDAAERAGCRAIGGLGMLVCQGAVSLSLWTGLQIEQMPIDAMFAALAV